MPRWEREGETGIGVGKEGGGTQGSAPVGRWSCISQRIQCCRIFGCQSNDVWTEGEKEALLECAGRYLEGIWLEGHNCQGYVCGRDMQSTREKEFDECLRIP